MRQLQELPKTADVVIIGGGIVGCATAFYLARTGRSPLLIERSGAIASATTAVSAHAIRCQFAERENIDRRAKASASTRDFAMSLVIPPLK